jgi:hypothetical protein
MILMWSRSTNEYVDMRAIIGLWIICQAGISVFILRGGWKFKCVQPSIVVISFASP